jgi:hypothetical protein
MQAYVGVARWFPVSLNEPDGTEITGLTHLDVEVTIQYDNGTIIPLALTGASDWLPFGRGVYRFKYTPEAGENNPQLMLYWVDTTATFDLSHTGAVTYEGAIDVYEGIAVPVYTDPTSPQNTLAGIRQMAMDRVDEQTNPDSGRFSTTWWNRQINYVYRFLAQHTGFYIKRSNVATTANQYIVPAPTDLCWGVIHATYEDTPLTAKDTFELDSAYPAWERSAEGTPTEYVVNWPNIELRPPPDKTVRADAVVLTGTAGAAFSNQPLNDQIQLVSNNTGDKQVVRVYGTTFRTNTVVVEDITLNGTTAVLSIKTDWDYMLGMEIYSGAAVSGTIKMQKVTGTVDMTNATIGAGTTQKGVTNATMQETGDVRPLVSATGTISTLTTANLGIVGLVGEGVTDNAITLPATANEKIKLPNSMLTVTKVLLGAVPATRSVTVYTGTALEVLHGAVPAELVSEDEIPKIPDGFTYLLGDGAAVMAMTGDLRYNESTNSQTAPLLQQFWQGVSQLENYLDTIQRERTTVLEVISPHSPYA